MRSVGWGSRPAAGNTKQPPVIEIQHPAVNDGAETSLAVEVGRRTDAKDDNSCGYAYGVSGRRHAERSIQVERSNASAHRASRRNVAGCIGSPPDR